MVSTTPAHYISLHLLRWIGNRAKCSGQTIQEKLADLIGISQNVLSKNLRDIVKMAASELVFGPGGKPYE